MDPPALRGSVKGSVVSLCFFAQEEKVSPRKSFHISVRERGRSQRHGLVTARSWKQSVHCSPTEARARGALPWAKATHTSHLLLEICSNVRGSARNTEKWVPRFPHQETYTICTKMILKPEHVFQ